MASVGLRASEARLDLIFLDRRRRRDDDNLPLLPNVLSEDESDQSVKTVFQESILRIESESDSSLLSHSITGKALTLLVLSSLKFSVKKSRESFESTLLGCCLVVSLGLQIVCWASNACVAGDWTAATIFESFLLLFFSFSFVLFSLNIVSFHIVERLKNAFLSWHATLN